MGRKPNLWMTVGVAAVCALSDLGMRPAHADVEQCLAGQGPGGDHPGGHQDGAVSGLGYQPRRDIA